MGAPKAEVADVIPEDIALDFTPPTKTTGDFPEMEDDEYAEIVDVEEMQNDAEEVASKENVDANDATDQGDRSDQSASKVPQVRKRRRMPVEKEDTGVSVKAVVSAPRGISAIGLASKMRVSVMRMNLAMSKIKVSGMEGMVISDLAVVNFNQEGDA